MARIRGVNEYFFRQAFGNMSKEDQDKVRKLIKGINKFLGETGYEPW